MIRLVVAEDERLMREAVVSLLDLEPDFDVVAAAASGDEAVDLIRTHRPEIALLDFELPVFDGVEVAEFAAEVSRPTKCVIITRHARPGVLRRALAAGVSGFTSKSVPAATLAQIIRRVHQGGRYVDPELAMAAIDTQAHPLTRRELEVLRHVQPSTTAAQIGSTLHLSPGTVRNYLSSAIQKLGVNSRLEARDHALDYGWL